VDAFPASFSAGHCADAVVHATPSLSDFFPEPYLVSELSGTWQGSGIIILMCLCSKCFLLFLPFNVRKHLFRIIRSSLVSVKSLSNAHFTRFCELLKITQTPRRETYFPCEGLIFKAFNGDYYTFYHNYFMFSKI
jgi:hypothetical protein